jgi:hypothetical protein
VDGKVPFFHMDSSLVDRIALKIITLNQKMSNKTKSKQN